MSTKFRAAAAASLAVLAALAAGTTAAQSATAAGHARHHRAHPSSHRVAGRPAALPGGYKHLVVIYEENHSFDNLYGSWGDVNGQHVVGLSDAKPKNTVQRAQDGTAYSCLLQNDVNLASPPLSSACHDSHTVYKSDGTAQSGFDSAFANRPFAVDDYIKPEDTTCPKPGQSAPNGVPRGTGDPGGCTRDLVHRFYQEQYQIDRGKQDRYSTGSDAVGLTQGIYNTKTLPIYRYLHAAGAPNYVLADNFFQGAFGGSFLNHQFLIAARAPLDTSARNAEGAKASTATNSILDANGMVTKYPLYNPEGTVRDGQLTRACADGQNHPKRACGDYAVNTVQPSSAPSGGGAKIPLIDDSKYPNIGDRLSAKGISWNWYSGGWDAAESGQPGPLFQYHHQPFNYFANYAKGAPGRSHLQDEKNFISSAKAGTLPTVSFVKPYGAENEHPGYTGESGGSDHLVDLLKTVTEGPQAKDTLVVVTYDEFGGQWDHVSPPKTDKWGPGTRIPALVISRSLKRSGVDHTQYDTTSILATLEHSYGLEPLSSRDKRVHDLSRAVAAGGR